MVFMPWEGFDVVTLWILEYFRAIRSDLGTLLHSLFGNIMWLYEALDMNTNKSNACLLWVQNLFFRFKLFITLLYSITFADITCTKLNYIRFYRVFKKWCVDGMIIQICKTLEVNEMRKFISNSSDTMRSLVEICFWSKSAEQSI